jgi:hypothetical protein
MNLLSQIIMQICMMQSSDKCVEKLHVCVRENFGVQWFDTLTWQQELVLPVQIKWCESKP